MPDSPSGFVDFNQYYDQNKDEEQRLMEEAMARAQGADAKAQSALGRSQQEAKGHFNARGVNAGEYTDAQSDITKTASYGDYLQAKKEAEDAYAGLSAPSMNPFAEAVHGALRAKSQIDEQARAAQAALVGRDAKATGGVHDFATEADRHLGASADKREADYQAGVQAKADKAKQDEAYRQSLRDRMKAGWDRQDKYAGSFGINDPIKGTGGFTIYGENMTPYGAGNGDPESTKLAQDARAWGLSDEADRYQSGATYVAGKRTKGGY